MVLILLCVMVACKTMVSIPTTSPSSRVVRLLVMYFLAIPLTIQLELKSKAVPSGMMVLESGTPTSSPDTVLVQLWKLLRFLFICNNFLLTRVGSSLTMTFTCIDVSSCHSCVCTFTMFGCFFLSCTAYITWSEVVQLMKW